MPEKDRCAAMHPRGFAVLPLLRSTAALLIASPRLAQSFLRRPFLTTSTIMASTTQDTSLNLMTPPVARREEDRVVYVGAAPDGWDPKVPRQAESSEESLVTPPVAVADPYGWLRDEKRENEEMLELLKAENAYTSQVTGHLEGLRESLYKEMLSSIQETDYTTPRPYGDFFYYSRTYEGKSYKVHVRAPRQANNNGDESVKIDWDGTAGTPILADEQVLLDVNELGKDKPYCATGSVTTSPSHKLLAYAADFSGDETCQMFVKDLQSGEIVDHDESLEISGSIRWGSDDSTLFYLKMDDAHRPYQVYKRTLGGKGEDELLLEEPGKRNFDVCYCWRVLAVPS